MIESLAGRSDDNLSYRKGGLPGANSRPYFTNELLAIDESSLRLGKGSTEGVVATGLRRGED